MTSAPTFRPEFTPELLNAKGRGHLPGLIGIEILSVRAEGVESRVVVRTELFAPNGFLHAATVVALADTSCGYGCASHLPEGAAGFTTVELKSNHVGTARDGSIFCTAVPVHLGRTTQVWDAVVTVEGTERRIALFRCTQMVLWPREG
ncbi:MAG: PaaI family thioesterase [Betaproteobacteria bacterium]